MGIRNGIAGSMTVVTATCFLCAFYYASVSWNVAFARSLWTSGFMLMMNLLRCALLYICMTVTYKDWKVMLFPWIVGCTSMNKAKHVEDPNQFGHPFIEAPT